MSGHSRGQSELVGVVLLIGVFVVVATLIGVAIIGNVLSQADDAPLVEANVSATADNVTIVHAGGDAMDVDDVFVVVRRDTERTVGLGSFTELTGDGDARFEPGERRRRPHPFGAGRLEVLVVHRPTNEVVYSDAVDAG